MRKAMLFIGLACWGFVLLPSCSLDQEAVVSYRSPSVSAVIVDAATGLPIEGADVCVRWRAIRRTGNEHAPALMDVHVEKVVTDKNGVFITQPWGPIRLARKWEYCEFDPSVTYSKLGYEKYASADNGISQDKVTANAWPNSAVTLDQPSWAGQKIPLGISKNKEDNLGMDGNVPVAFYGRVVDENGLPVPGAVVNYEIVRSLRGGSGRETESCSMVTDQHGDFKISGIFAYSLVNFSAQKDGYEFAQKGPFNYRFGLKPNYHPDPADPQLFKMSHTQQVAR